MIVCKIELIQSNGHNIVGRYHHGILQRLQMNQAVIGWLKHFDAVLTIKMIHHKQPFNALVPHKKTDSMGIEAAAEIVLQLHGFRMILI